MKRYQPSRFRPAFGLAAVVLSALTMVLTIGVPANLSNVDPQSRPVIAAEVTINPARIDVLGVRDPNVAASSFRSTRG